MNNMMSDYINIFHILLGIWVLYMANQNVNGLVITQQQLYLIGSVLALTHASLYYKKHMTSPPSL